MKAKGPLDHDEVAPDPVELPDTSVTPLVELPANPTELPAVMKRAGSTK